MDCETVDSLCGKVLSGAILGPALNKRLVAKKSSADGSCLAKLVAFKRLASVILDEYRSAKPCLSVSPATIPDFRLVALALRKHVRNDSPLECHAVGVPEDLSHTHP